MSLNYIYIDGFRNVKETKIEFNQITGLLSVNSYGKSNLLTAFEFGTLFSQILQEKKHENGIYKWSAFNFIKFIQRFYFWNRIEFRY